MRLRVNYLLCCCLMIPLLHGTAQGRMETGTISGTVYESGQHIPLVGANVFLRNTMIGTSTDLLEYILANKKNYCANSEKSCILL
ncbi:MAG: hypothetical protein V1799_00385 [bacterium]